MSPTYPESLSINKGRYSGDTATALVDGTVAQPSVAFADDSDTGIYSPADGTVCFTVDGTERLRIVSAGSLLHNCTTAPDKDDPGSAFIADANQGQLRVATNASGSAVLCTFFNANGNVGDIRTNASATSYNTSSDYRLKENAVAISDGITRLKTLKPYRFNFKADSSKIVDGFFAHEVTAVPEAITGEKDGTEMQVIDQSKLVPLLTAALQEAIAEIETLKTKVAALEAG